MRKIIDAFTFFNELELLQIRLQYLWPVVDKFVIAEASLTHSGAPKEFVFLKNINLFQNFINKIEYIQIDLKSTPERYNDLSDINWARENYQRDAILKVVEKEPSEFLLCVTDVDEIWNIEWAEQLRNDPNFPQIARFQMDLFRHFLNFKVVQSRSGVSWTHGFCMTSGFTRPEGLSLSKIRTHGLIKHVLSNGGWHFSSCYGASTERLKEKLESFAHREFAFMANFTDDLLRQKVGGGDDIFGDKTARLEVVNKSCFPPVLATILERYPRLLKMDAF